MLCSKKPFEKAYYWQKIALSPSPDPGPDSGPDLSPDPDPTSNDDNFGRCETDDDDPDIQDSDYDDFGGCGTNYNNKLIYEECITNKTCI